MATYQTSTVALLIMLLSVVCSSIPREKVYYISPSHDSPCPVSSCLTLSQFADSPSHYLASETTLSFISGNHSLRSRLLIGNITALAMISTHSNVLITCNLHGMFELIRTDKVYIKNIHFFGCTGHKLLVSQFVLEGVRLNFNRAQVGAADVFTISTSILYIEHSTIYTIYDHYNITIAYSQISKSYGQVLHVGDSYVNFANHKINISNSRITHSAHGVLFSHIPKINITITQSLIIDNNGTVVFARGDTEEVINVVLSISNSSLIHNSGNIIVLDLYATTTSGEPASLITISYCHIVNNSGLVISGLYKSILVVNHTHIIAHQGEIIDNPEASSVFIAHSKIIHGSGVAVLHNFDGGDGDPMNVNIHDTQFIHNRGGILHSGGLSIAVIIVQSLFVNNTDSLGGVFKLLTSATMTIINSSFINNTAYNHGGVIHINQADVVIIQTTFTGNRARNGGVVSLLGGSLTVINSSFTHNSADHEGGVIYVESGVVQNLYTKLKNATIIHDSHFWNNTAGLNGGVIAIQYGYALINGGNYGGNFALDGGVFQVYQGHLRIINITCHGNTASANGGVIHSYQSTAIVSQCYFYDNNAMNDGGAINAYQGNLTIHEDTSFKHNVASNYGGAIFAFELHTVITGNSYLYNEAGYRGGTWFTYQGSFTTSESIIGLSTSNEGGVLYADQGVVEMYNISCVQNKATYGGALHMDEGNLTVHHSSFSQNVVKEDGGAWLVTDSQLMLQRVSFIKNIANDGSGGAMHSTNNSLSISCTTLKQNVANREGGAMYLYTNTIESSNSLLIESNRANKGAIFLFNSAVYLYKESVFSYNFGSFLMLYSNVTFTGTTRFISGSEPIESQSIHDIVYNSQEGGVLTVYKSKVIFGGNSSLMYNYAQIGGAILATESKIHVEGVITVAYNKANRTGGGVYLDMSAIYCQGNSFFSLLGNSATNEGGGAYVTNSIISVRVSSRSSSVIEKNASYSIHAAYKGSFLHFIQNEAEKGGGLYLKTNSKVYIFNSMCHSSLFYVINFTANSADYGGSVYVSDDTYLGLCNPEHNSHFRAKECIFQVFATYTIISHDFCQNTKSIFFSSNYARFSGSDLFGGLIDRCKVHYFTEFHKIMHFRTFSAKQTFNEHTLINGLSYMLNISNIQVSSISSEPAQLCLCKHNIPDCNFQPDSFKVTKTKSISVELIAIDQVNHPVRATIHNSLLKTNGGLGKGQDIQYVNDTCTELKFNFSSPYDSEELIMRVEGPCQSSPFSQRRLKMHFTLCNFCPIGFEKHITEDTICECICDSQLAQFITICNITTEKLQRKGSYWISYVYGNNNSTNGYLTYPHCPYNYCHPPTSTVEINLNTPDGADAQCAYSRSGILCGTCPRNLSLSLGTSHCIPCSTNWHLLIISATFIAGIALITILCAFNLTVTVGTLNGILFYANIVAADKTTFFPFSKPNFATIFISWLNLDIGFDVCFFKGMDAYWKTLLQLAFPTYVIILIVLVIIISECSTKFRQLVYKRNPMAILSTIVLFSFTKFLNNAILFLSFASLDFPDGSHKTVWLPDASVQYLSGKHIFVFILAIFILVASMAFTVLLFSWQFILPYQGKPIFMWTRYHRLRHSIEPYLAAYNEGQHYWTGLLLFMRMILYTVAAINVGGLSKANLVLTNVLVLCLLLLKGTIKKHIYKIGLIDVVEMITYFNVICFAILTLMMNKNQDIIAYISVSVTITSFLTVLIFHAFHYTCLSNIIMWAKVSTIGKILCSCLKYSEDENEMIL